MTAKDSQPLFIEPSEECGDVCDWQVTRRDFVKGASAMTGGMVLSIPLPAAAKEATSSGLARPVPVQLHINGQPHDLSLDPRTSLLDLLRDQLHLTGTKKGCDHGQCGACTVLVNGRRINSCLSLAVTHQDDQVTTIEGLANGEELHPMQAAFLEYDGFQCGYCTPGQICSAVALLAEAKQGAASYATADLRKTGPAALTTDEIRERMSGNLCRCGAYPGIVLAVEAVYKQSA